MHVWWACIVVGAIVAGCTAPACTVVAFEQQVLVPRQDFSDTAGIRVADVDGDGAQDILVAQPLHQGILVLQGCPAACQATSLTQGLVAPVRVQAVDLDGDGLQDLLVSDIGELFPSDVQAGRVVWLRATGPWTFETRVLLQGVGRIACAEAADLDGDADLDIALCIFGHEKVGSLAWMERTPQGYEVHHLDPRPGTIHAFPTDLDGDGDLDLATVLAQGAEEVVAWINDGKGSFTKRVLASGGVPYYGMSGIHVTDLDRDADPDIVVLHGDVYDHDLPSHIDPTEFHGAYWLENEGGSFERHDLAQGWGMYGVQSADLDGDADLDLAIGSLQVDAFFPSLPRNSFLWLENDGQQRFTRHDVEGLPSHLVPMEAADLDGDGRMELLVGSLVADRSAAGTPLVRVVPQARPCA